MVPPQAGGRRVVPKAERFARFVTAPTSVMFREADSNILLGQPREQGVAAGMSLRAPQARSNLLGCVRRDAKFSAPWRWWWGLLACTVRKDMCRFARHDQGGWSRGQPRGQPQGLPLQAVSWGLLACTGPKHMCRFARHDQGGWSRGQPQGQPQGLPLRAVSWGLLACTVRKDMCRFGRHDRGGWSRGQPRGQPQGLPLQAVSWGCSPALGASTCVGRCAPSP